MISKFINDIVRGGNKNVSRKNFFKTVVLLKNSKLDQNIDVVLKKSVLYIQPRISLESKKIAGNVVRIPRPYTNLNAFNLSIKMLVNSSKKQGSNPFHKKLHAEIVESMNKRGVSFKKKISVHKGGLSNRSNIKYS